MKTGSIKKRMILHIILFLTILLGVVAALTYRYFKQATRSMVYSQQYSLVTNLAAEADEKLRLTQSMLLNASDIFSSEALLDDDQMVQHWVGEYLALRNFFNRGIFVLDAQGELRAFYEKELEQSKTAAAYIHKLTIQTLESNKSIISSPVACPTTAHPIVLITAPFCDHAGKQGVLIGGIDLVTQDGIFSKLANYHVGSTGYAYLFAMDRTMILHPKPSRIMKQDVPVGANKLFDKAIEGFEGAGETVNSKGLHTLVAFKHLERTPWILALNFPVAEAFAPIAAFLKYFFLGMAAFLLLSILLAVKLSSFITVPIQKLAEQMDEISHSNQHHQLLATDQCSGEMALLVSSFNRMLKRLELRMSEFEHNLRVVFDNTDKGIIIHDQQGQILSTNRPAQQLFGLNEEDFLSLTVADLSAENDEKTAQIPQLIQRVLDGENLSMDWCCWKFVNKSSFDSQIYYTRITWNNESVLMGMVQDVTELKERNALIHRLNIAVEQSANAVVVTDLQGEIEYANPVTEQVTGYAIKELIGKTPGIFKSDFHPSTFHEELWKTILSGEIWRGELCNKHKDGHLIWESTVITPIVENQQVTHFVVIKEDITKRKQYESELYRHANFDALTQLPNRTMLLEQLQSVTADKQNGGKIVLMLLDLDDFRTINDSLGHSVGDSLLKAVAERLKACLTQEDQLFRLGGDEYTILPKNIQDDSQLEALAGVLMQSFVQPFVLSPEQEIFITASMGITLYPKDGSDAEDLLRNADTAMYFSKNKGRNTFERYNTELNVQLQEKQQLTHMLRRALDNNEFLLYYQPQQELVSDKITGFEALLRWQPQEGTMIFPDKFIPILEETGMIVPVGEWVLREVCQQVKRWQKQGVTFKHASVNISYRQFQRPNIVQEISEVIHETGVEPSMILLELTESIMVENMQENLVKLNELRAAGFGLSIDDFGTGYSSLNYLRQMPIHELKIDRSFINSLADDSTLVKTILAMAHSLGLWVVAEGVETDEQRQYLESHGCEVMQGYLLSRPLSQEQFEEFIKTHTDS